MNLIEFLADSHVSKFVSPSRVNNAWLLVGSMDVYCRKANHLIGTRVLRTFDIANVIIQNPDERGAGTFKTFLKSVEDQLDSQLYDAIFIENVINKRLDFYLYKNGYIQAPSSLNGAPPCYYKLLPLQNEQSSRI